MFGRFACTLFAVTLDWLLGWWNLVYLVPLGLALAYLFAYALSGWTFGEADVDVDAEADVDVEAEAEARADINADGDVGHTPGGILAALTWLGVGRVPLSIVGMVLLLTFGLAGFAVNQLLRDALGATAVAVSLPAAIVSSLGLTAIVSRLIGRYLPLNESSALARRDLVGRRGTVVFAVTSEAGTVAVRDAGGDRYQVAARSGDGVIPAGTEVVLVSYDEGTRTFAVVPSGL